MCLVVVSGHVVEMTDEEHALDTQERFLTEYGIRAEIQYLG